LVVRLLLGEFTARSLKRGPITRIWANWQLNGRKTVVDFQKCNSPENRGAHFLMFTNPSKYLELPD
jgi:hypothetical protein